MNHTTKVKSVFKSVPVKTGISFNRKIIQNINEEIEEIKNYILIQNHTQAETAKYFGITILQLKEIMVKFNLDKTAYKQNMTASFSDMIIKVIAEEEISKYIEDWKSIPPNLNAFKHYIENNEIVINADSKFVQVAHQFEFRRYGREIVAV